MAKILLVMTFVVTNILSLKSQTLFGTAFTGGAEGGGTITKFIDDTKNLTVEKSFDAVGFASFPGLANLIQANDGTLYGMTTLGGNDGYGVLFSYDPVSFAYRKLKDFNYTDGAVPFGSLLQTSDGKLYGMTYGGGINGYGVIFSIDPATSAYTILQQFDNSNGSFPKGSLIQATDGKLYGMTSAGGSTDGGVIFSFDPINSIYTKLEDLDANTGYAPEGSLLQANNGKLYGMTTSGGGNLAGTIFSFDPSTLIVTKLSDFDNTNGASPHGSLLQASDGKLYGMTAGGGINSEGVIFSFDAGSSTYEKLLDLDFFGGASPLGSLIQAVDGNLFGMATGGGLNGGGVIFALDLSSRTYTRLMNFDVVHGGNPQGSLLQASNGKLYGLTSTGAGGDAGSFGVIFSFDVSNNTYTVEKAFAANQNGSNLSGALIRARDGKLYGMTTNGGSNGWGVIFSFDPLLSVYTKLKDFDYSNGSHPYGSLLQAPDGKLYGLTTHGGDRDPECCDYGDVGVMFSYDPNTSVLKRLMRFDNYILRSGSLPYGSPTGANDGKLYGLTESGGSGYRGFGGGVIFSFDTSTSAYTSMDLLSCDIDCISNSDSNGIAPYGSLVLARDGKFYGMTSLGGNNQYGVLFSYDRLSATYKKLVEFDGTNGANPYGSLIVARDGKLYGMTYGGGSSDAGVIFSFDITSSTFNKLIDFDFVNGGHPYGNLMQASNGKLYGSTSTGGANDYGVIFSYDPVSSTFTKLADYDGSNGANVYLGSTFIELAESASLPVMLSNFSGRNRGSINELSWKVGNEHDVAYYELQRSIDGQGFNQIVRINATGNSKYAYDDNIGTTNAVYFYRLKIVDIDGNFKYSNVIKLEVNLNDLFVVVNPNPFTNRLTITLRSPIQDKAIFVLKDLSGRQLFDHAEQVSKGTNVVAINEIGGLASGTYILTIFTSSGTQSFKVIKVK